MPAVIRVLLVDDERAFARSARRVLAGGSGVPRIKVDDVRSGHAALARLETRRYEVVLVDWNLQDMDGVELGSRIRRTSRVRGCGLVIVTGRCVGSRDQCAALDAGFDDFVVKPFDAGVLRARIAALARRVSRVRRTQADDPKRVLHPTIDVLPDEPVALVFSRHVKLGVCEWKILATLCAHRGEVVSRSTLELVVWRADPPADPRRRMDEHVSGLRAKIGDTGRRLVETVRGVGFRLSV